MPDNVVLGDLFACADAVSDLDLRPALLLEYCAANQVEPARIWSCWETAAQFVGRLFERRPHKELLKFSQVAIYVSFLHDRRPFDVIAFLTRLDTINPHGALRIARTFVHASDSEQIVQDVDRIMTWSLIRSKASWSVKSSNLAHLVQHVRLYRTARFVQYWVDLFMSDQFDLLIGQRYDCLLSLGRAISFWNSPSSDLILNGILSFLMSSGDDGFARLFVDNIFNAHRTFHIDRMTITDAPYTGLDTALCTIDPSRIHVVDQLRSLNFARDTLMSSTIVGIDTETRPWFSKDNPNGPNPVSILQISTRDVAFIFDLLYFPSNDRSSLFEMLKQLLSSKNIIKLGVAFQKDLQDLHQSYPHEDCFLSASTCVDLNEMMFNLYPGTAVKSLSKLCRFALKSRLSKALQMTNWNQRPLSNEQVHYAALDAHVLVLIAIELCEQRSLILMDFARDLSGASEKKRPIHESLTAGDG